MVRTNVVEMASIKGITYRQKLKSGGSGLTIMTEKDKAVVTINKRDGAYLPFGTLDAKIFTEAVFEEAFDLTQGLPYRRLHPVQYKERTKDEAINAKVAIDAEDEINDDVATICSKEYDAIIAEYTAKCGSFSYDLMNKDFIQRAHKSDRVKSLINQDASVDEIIVFLLVTKVNNLIRESVNNFSDEDAQALIKMLDDMNMRSAFKELKKWLRGRKSLPKV
jgi:hypothetical protein